MRNAILTAAAIVLTFTAGSMLADESNKKTKITVNEAVLVPGKELPAGTYVMKLADSQSNRNIVQIFNEDETELQAMFIAFPNNKIDRDEETVITFWETPAGVPPAVRAWFWPGDTWGQEFAYPKELAQQIAAANNDATVPQDEGLTEEEATEIAANQGEEQESETALQTQPQAPAVSPDPVTEAQPATDTDAIDRGDIGGVEERPNSDVLAQNTPAPQREPLPSLNEDSDQGAGVADPALSEVDELPRTGSPVPWILLTGILAGAGALMLRRVNG